ncbi:UNVERIFIED_CONTAM: LINE-1 retrotransposable element O protein [Sesamum latifolium]|uniref:LINE-1 retrotransposable element O protein n=1 Tax=Sesamum latifolium TaxID=2727402 RepID=A0AAW2VXP9_9LAMI
MTKQRGSLSQCSAGTGFLGDGTTTTYKGSTGWLLLLLEHCCRLVLLNATKLEQVMLQQRAKIQWLKGGDQCSRVFFRKVASRWASKRIFQIQEEGGRTLSDPHEVVGKTIITEGDTEALLKTVTATEVKRVFFDVEEEKAPSPDGYSAGFYKATWPIVGEKVTRAILEFFITGKLLKQLNATLLVLIPKVQAPSFVSEYRPIACSTVIYKVITKILVQRLSLVLDRLISPSQNAFLSGRSIWNNILLTQELFTGYNQQRLPPRCALKVDLRKAYDSVERNFLLAVLDLFGFPVRFIQWIEECVTTPSFSVCLNGTPHGFFTGARGLRQGDPMSPYFFVLVMEVLHLILAQIIDQDDGFKFHWKFQEIGLFQLCFADDLLLFCRADESSVGVFKQGLETFAGLFGLQANPSKSNLIISASARNMKEALLALLDFREGTLPIKYLGLPLLSSRLTIADCKPLLTKVDGRIKGWAYVRLSFAGQV